MAPPMGFVLFWSDAIGVLVGLGDGLPQTTQGYGGWEEIELARRKSLTTWKGRVPWRKTVPLLFDTLSEDSRGAELESYIRNLERLAGGGISGEPPVIQFDSGGLIPDDYTDAAHVRWVIDAIEWGDAIRDGNGNRLRQACTVTLLEYVADEHLKELASKSRSAKKGKCTGAKRKRYVVKKGDTLVRIAKHELKDANCWRAIANANKAKKLRDPRKAIKAGTVLRLP